MQYVMYFMNIGKMMNEIIVNNDKIKTIFKKIQLIDVYQMFVIFGIIALVIICIYNIKNWKNIYGNIPIFQLDLQDISE